MFLRRSTYDAALREARAEGAASRDGEVRVLEHQLSEANARGDRLAEGLKRIARHERGMPEVEPKPRPAPKPWTPELKQLRDSFSDEFRDVVTASIEAGLARGMEPDDVWKEILDQQTEV